MDTRFTLHVAPAGDVLEAARDCEELVFDTVYGNSREEWVEEYGPYDANSVFLAVTEPGGDAIAAMRIIRPGPIGLKTLVDTARPPWFVDGERAARSAGLDLAATWDVATVAMRPRVPGSSLVPAALYHAMFQAARLSDIRWIVMILDARVRRLLNALSIDTQPLPGCRPGPYLGSASSLPLWGDLPAMADRQRRDAPDAHRLVNLGIGLTDIALPAQEAFRIGATPAIPARRPAVPAGQVVATPRD
ncbi:hypothetical protein SAMN05443575_3668 [Jatrophihabitans endophyticus]|uniref:N-acyl-L-homoserine lactone synthetase n=1 Tax=Jatrophihabitans endophyticus TaxID=1206085 RepID=A0A1M5RWC2_9ACTN|nr:hypothetical protein [Jatrophihabitans endophyticus]SHH30536.1 hypothetical protein SAMN05443575_3668 [Jatrophihabitans endophyticus]